MNEYLLVCERNFCRQMYSKILKSGSSVYSSVFFSSVCNSMPSKFFVRVVRSGALVYNSYFFQNRRFTEIIRHQNLNTRLPTRQDGFQNRDRIYFIPKSFPCLLLFLCTFPQTIKLALKFKDFPAPTAIFKDFEGLKFVFIKFKDFQGASEPCM